MRPRLLDLFCGAGGAAVGYHRAGFDVVGVDINPQPNFPFEFVQADALHLLDAFLGDVVLADGTGILDFDAIHASPPCQAHTLMQAVAGNAAAHPDLVGPVREQLEATGLPYVIENVVGAPLRNAHLLCGSMFGLGAETPHGRLELRRHRLFECNWYWLAPNCQHRGRTLGLYGDHARSNRRHGEQTQLNTVDGLAAGRSAMEMPWASWREIAEAIPPAYTEFIGAQLMAHLTERAPVLAKPQTGALTSA